MEKIPVYFGTPTIITKRVPEDAITMGPGMLVVLPEDAILVFLQDSAKEPHAH